jgi:hypothetical protein
MTSRLRHGSSITAHKPIRISNGPATTFPPASTNLLIAAGTEATKRSVSIGRFSVCSTSSASESGSLNPAAESSLVTKSITIERERHIKICNWDAMAIDFSEECSHLL